jgi:hypothetical protein
MLSLLIHFALHMPLFSRCLQFARLRLRIYAEAALNSTGSLSGISAHMGRNMISQETSVTIWICIKLLGPYKHLQSFLQQYVSFPCCVFHLVHFSF